MELSSNKHSTIVVYKTFNAISKIRVDFVKTRENILSNIWFAVMTSTLFLFSLFNGSVYTKFNLKRQWPKWCETAKAWTRCTNIFAKILQMYWRILFRNSKYVYDICASDEFRAYEVWTEAFNGMCVYLEMLVFVMLFVLVFDIKHIFTSTLVESVIHRPPLERLDVHWYVCKRPQCIKPTPMNNPKILESPLRASYASHSLHRHEKQKFDFQL